MREPMVCVTVAAATLPELRRQRDRAAERADLVELRLDHLEHPDAPGALEGRRRPAVVTCRPAWEGGRFQGSEEERRRVLDQAIAAGAEFVDVEARAAFAAEIIRCRRGRGVVLSSHFFGEPPADLAAVADTMRSSGAEVVKIAIEARGLADTLPLFALAGRDHGTNGAGHVLVAMGEAGVASRVLAARLGNRWTYAGDGVAPGQVPVATLVEDLAFRRLRADSAVFGVVGNPVLHSWSPRMHNAGFAARGLNAAYVPLHAVSADDFTRFGRGIGIAGASITAPFKVALMDYVDEIDPLARRVGAINTIVVEGRRWTGTNTDVEGFLAPLAGRVALAGARASILGAGGAARAAAVALAGQGATVTVCARRPERALLIAELAGGRVGTFPPAAGSWDVLVNTIPGSDPPGNPVGGAPLDGRVVYDLVYVPRETPLLAAARAAGCLAIGGVEMLVAQAERQFELWTGEAPPAGVFGGAV